MRRERTPVISDCAGLERTKQAPAGEVNINQIMARYMKTGTIDHIQRRPPQYGDFSRATTLLEAWEINAQAEDEFNALDSNIRRAANNDKIQFWQMIATEEGARALAEAGLDLDFGDEVQEEQAPTPPSPPESGGQ